MKNFLFSFVFIFSIIAAHAQVTVGSLGDPEKAALLQLKDTEPGADNVTASTGGLLMPRVKLENKASLQPFIPNDSSFQNNVDQVKSKHIGLMVYNLTSDYSQGFCPGVYAWNGTLWERLSPACSVFEFLCSTLTVSSFSKMQGQSFSEVSVVYYNAALDIEVTSTRVHTYGNGLSILITPQSLKKGDYGSFYFFVQSDGTTAPGSYTLPLDDLGDELGVDISSSCELTVNILADSFSLLCTGLQTSLTANTYVSKTIQVPYNGAQTPYTIPAGNIGSTVHGITPSIASQQTLTSATGSIPVTLTGTPSVSGSFSLPITVNGSSCNITVQVAVPFTIECTDTYVTGFLNQNMSETTGTVLIPYTLTGGQYVLNGGIIGSLGNVTASIATQTLTAPSGYIAVNFSGLPLVKMDKAQFSITIEGNTCSIYLSIIDPPSVCPDGANAKAFVFQQEGKWYVVTGSGVYNGNSVAQVIECNTEEEALRHPEALQYCGATTITNGRCIVLFNRSGAVVKNIYMTESSAAWSTGLLQADTGCFASIVAYSGAQPRVIYPKTGNLGLLGTVGSDKRGLFGITTKTTTMSTKPLR